MDFNKLHQCPRMNTVVIPDVQTCSTCLQRMMCEGIKECTPIEGKPVYKLMPENKAVPIGSFIKTENGWDFELSIG